MVLQALFVAIAAGCAASGEEVAMIAGAIFLGLALIIHMQESMRLAKAFGRGVGYGLALTFFPRLARICLGLGEARYVRRDAREMRRAGEAFTA